MLAALSDRSVIRVTGEDRVAFLQGLVSNDVEAVTPEHAVWAAFLTPQGYSVRSLAGGMNAWGQLLVPRELPEPSRVTRFSGLEPIAITPDTGFVMIGERTNVTGSAKFRRLIEADDYQAALDVALEQVRGGANLIDVNMDADLLDSEYAMTRFLNLVATEPEVARIPKVQGSGAGQPQITPEERSKAHQVGAFVGTAPPSSRLRTLSIASAACVAATARPPIER